MRGWIETTETGDRAELDVGAARVRSGRRSPSAPTAASAGSAPSPGRCFSEAARERASHAELVIANHALYFADLGLRSRTDAPAVLPEHDAVIFDEAHRLEESAATWLGGRISGPVIHRLLRDVDRACREASIPVPARALDRVDAAGQAGARRGRARVGPAATTRDPGRAGRGTRRPARRARRSADREEGRGGRGRRQRRFDSPPMSTPASRPTMATVSSGPSPTCSRGRPVDVGGALDRAPLGAAGTTAILVSATLTVGGDVRVRPRPAGPDRGPRAGGRLAVRLPRAGAALPAARLARPAVAAARSSGRPRRSAALCRISGGRALVLTSSYRALDAVAAGIRGASPTRCSSRARRRASGCSSASGTRSPRCSSPPRPSGRGSTSRASRCRCS